MEFVDQQVAEAVVELQLQFAGFIAVPQGVQGLLGDFGKIDFARLLKHQPELRGGHFEQLQQVGDEGAVGAGVVRVGQAPHPRQRCRSRFGQRREAVFECRGQCLAFGAGETEFGRDF